MAPVTSQLCGGQRFKTPSLISGVSDDVSRGFPTSRFGAIWLRNSIVGDSPSSNFRGQRSVRSFVWSCPNLTNNWNVIWRKLNKMKCIENPFSGSKYVKYEQNTGRYARAHQTRYSTVSPIPPNNWSEHADLTRKQNACRLHLLQSRKHKSPPIVLTLSQIDQTKR